MLLGCPHGPPGAPLARPMGVAAPAHAPPAATRRWSATRRWGCGAYGACPGRPPSPPRAAAAATARRRSPRRHRRAASVRAVAAAGAAALGTAQGRGDMVGRLGAAAPRRCLAAAAWGAAPRRGGLVARGSRPSGAPGSSAAAARCGAPSTTSCSRTPRLPPRGGGACWQRRTSGRGGCRARATRRTTLLCACSLAGCGERLRGASRRCNARAQGPALAGAGGQGMGDGVAELGRGSSDTGGGHTQIGAGRRHRESQVTAHRVECLGSRHSRVSWYADFRRVFGQLLVCTAHTEPSGWPAW